jgi:acyl-CoA reductase-like NAD-dependent aldehyde dehydrogenase
VSSLDERELALLVEPGAVLAGPDAEELTRFCARFYEAMQHLGPPLRVAMGLETAFVRADCTEVLDGALEYVREFPGYWERCVRPAVALPPYELEGATRQIHLVCCAWGTVAVILPQNAFLILAVTTLLNALAAGNRVILRAPLQSARSAALLSVALEQAEPPDQAVSLVLSPARELLAALYRAPEPSLIHYFGSSRHAPPLLAEAFEHGKAALIDGEGNGWVWVGEDAAVAASVERLTAGALRYNGQTCTSINGAIIHPAIYRAVCDRLIEKWLGLKAGNPLAGVVDVGPLFDERQAEACEQQIRESGGQILCGGSRRENLLPPTLVEKPRPDSALVTEGLFGPALWIAPGDAATFHHLWRQNRYPLCAGVLSPAAEAAAWAQLPNLARLVMNGDPSLEHVFEPWGGYPASGLDPVDHWPSKYQRRVQVDTVMAGD